MLAKHYTSRVQRRPAGSRAPGGVWACSAVLTAWRFRDTPRGLRAQGRSPPESPVEGERHVNRQQSPAPPGLDRQPGSTAGAGSSQRVECRVSGATPYASPARYRVRPVPDEVQEAGATINHDETRVAGGPGPSPPVKRWVAWPANALAWACFAISKGLIGKRASLILLGDSAPVWAGFRTRA